MVSRCRHSTPEHFPKERTAIPQPACHRDETNSQVQAPASLRLAFVVAHQMTLDTVRGEAAAQQRDPDPGPGRSEVQRGNHTQTAVLMPLLPAISRTLSLSFQSSFHRSLTVLIRYRSLANI